jgi:hypothetical protein
MSGDTRHSSGQQNQLNSRWLIAPDQEVEIRWILVFCDKDTDPYHIMEEVVQLDWVGEIARRKIQCNQHLQINTGNADLDFSLAFSQRQARLTLNQLFLQEGSEQTDLQHSPFQYWQLLLALTPLDSITLERLLKSAFRTTENQTPQFPLQAEIIWRACQAGLRSGFLEAFLPLIDKNLNDWFSKENDKDGDGIPEQPRDISLLFGIDPILDQEGDSRLGEELVEEYLENPGLTALLHNEICQLKTLQDMVTDRSWTSKSRKRTSNLEKFILASWHENTNQFNSRDFQSHLSGKGFFLEGLLHPGWNAPQVSLQYPSRLLVQVPRPEGSDYLQVPVVTFHGLDWQGRYRIEELTSNKFNWQDNTGWGMTQSIYTQIDNCVVWDLKGTQSIQIKAPQSDLQDLRLTLPLWMVGLQENIGQKLVTKSIANPNCFWSDFGLKTYPISGPALISLPLNILVMQGMIRQGFSRLARDLFLRWIAATSLNLNETGTLFAAWSASSGTGKGKVNLLEGCLPIGLLLDLLEVRFQGTREIIVGEKCPHLFPVQLRYKGVEVTLREKETIIQRPDQEPILYPRGQEVIIHL